MRVQLIWFNLNATPKMSLGLALMARELIEGGHAVRIMHLNEVLGVDLDVDRICADIAGFGPDLLALSFGRNHVPHARRLLPHLRERFGAAHILCGGIHATLRPEAVLGWPEVDSVCIGEADGLIVPFVDRLESGEDISGLPSFWGKGAGGIWKNAMAPLPDITHQTRIDFDHIDHAAALEYNRGMFEVISGRGCPGSCSFCFNPALRAVYRRYLPDREGGLPYCRKRGVDNLLGEMKEAMERFGDRLKMFSFADDAFNTDRDWILEFCEQYAAQIGLPYSCNLIIADVDRAVAGALKRSGAIAKIGVESGSERIRCRVLAKGFDNQAVRRGVGLLRAAGVPTRTYLMIGNPTETQAELLDTFRFAAELRPSSTRLCIFYPVEGSPLHLRCEREGLLTGQEYENYDDLSVLRWSPDMALLIKKVHAIHPWLQNRHLPEPAAGIYAPPVDQALEMDAGQWAQPDTLPWVRRTSIRLTRQLRDQGVLHYFNPFEERLDVTFLYSDEPVGLPNSDTLPADDEQEIGSP